MEESLNFGERVNELYRNCFSAECDEQAVTNLLLEFIEGSTETEINSLSAIIYFSGYSDIEWYRCVKSVLRRLSHKRVPNFREDELKLSQAEQVLVDEFRDVMIYRTLHPQFVNSNFFTSTFSHIERKARIIIEWIQFTKNSYVENENTLHRSGGYQLDEKELLEFFCALEEDKRLLVIGCFKDISSGSIGFITPQLADYVEHLVIRHGVISNDWATNPLTDEAELIKSIVCKSRELEVAYLQLAGVENVQSFGVKQAQKEINRLFGSEKPSADKVREQKKLMESVAKDDAVADAIFSFLSTFKPLIIAGIIAWAAYTFLL